MISPILSGSPEYSGFIAHNTHERGVCVLPEQASESGSRPESDISRSSSPGFVYRDYPRHLRSTSSSQSVVRSAPIGTAACAFAGHVSEGGLHLCASGGLVLGRCSPAPRDGVSSPRALVRWF